MYRKTWCLCKVVVLLNKPIAFLPFSLTSRSSLLKLRRERTDDRKCVCGSQARGKEAWYLKHRLPVVFPSPLTHLIAGYSPSCTFDIIFQVLQKSSKFGLNKLVMIEELAMWFSQSETEKYFEWIIIMIIMLMMMSVMITIIIINSCKWVAVLG